MSTGPYLPIHALPPEPVVAPPGMLACTARFVTGVVSTFVVVVKYSDLYGIGVSIPYINLAIEGAEAKCRTPERSYKELVTKGTLEIVSAFACSALALARTSEDNDLNYGLGMSLVYSWIALEGVNKLFKARDM